MKHARSSWTAQAGWTGLTLRQIATGQNEAQVDREGKDEDGHEGEREGREDETAQTGSVCEGELCDGCGEGLPG